MNAQHIPFHEAAQLATVELRDQQLARDYWTLHPEPPVVSEGCIRDLATAGKLDAAGPGLVDAGQVRDLFSQTRVIDGTGVPRVRVSITPLGASCDCDPLPDGRRRTWAGYDFANRDGLDPVERLAGIEGIWPLSEDTLRRATLHHAIFLPAMKGFADGGLLRQVVGYALDLTTKRRWINTQPLSQDELAHVLGDRQHLWVNVPKGPIAALTVESNTTNAPA